MRSYTLERPKTVAKSALLGDLNPQQRAVVEAGDGPMLVLAGAGTGKTRTLTYRTAHLIERGVSPDQIVLLTFTNKAAREMIERVDKLVPEVSKHIWAGTFHSIAHRVLRREAERLGYGTNYGILDTQEQRDLMEVTLGDVVEDVGKKRIPKREVLLAMLSTAVNTDRPLVDVLRREWPQFVEIQPEIEQILTAYLANKVEMNAMDYDDLLVNWRLLLEDVPEVRAMYAERFRYVLVDEYQDINRLQAAVVRHLSSHHGNVMVVGDDCQSIYAFRGAEVRNILDFPEEFEATQTYKLEINYRSTPQILEVANRSIAHNKEQHQKTLTAEKSAGELPACVNVLDATTQAAFVAQRVLELRDEGVELSEQAVLYRAHYQAMELQLELQRRGIPFTIRSGTRFFEQAHIRDVVAHLRVLFNPIDRLAWTRILKLQAGVGNKGAAKIFKLLTANGDPWGALTEGVIAGELAPRQRKAFNKVRDTLLALADPGRVNKPAEQLAMLLDGGYAAHLRESHPNAEQRIEDINQLSHYAARFDSYATFLEDLALVESVATEDIRSGGDSDEKLLLSTIHQAKGLEWEAVFVLSLADGQFPLRRALNSAEEEAEERRLFYVAVTRPRSHLYLCFPQWGTDRDRHRVMQRPSRFLHEIPHTREDLVETWRVS